MEFFKGAEQLTGITVEARGMQLMVRGSSADMELAGGCQAADVVDFVGASVLY